MKLLVYVLSQPDKLDALLAALATKRICGATVLESRGMARHLSHLHDADEIPILSSLRSFLNPEVAQGNVIFVILEDEKIGQVVEVIESTVAHLDEPDSGIVFTIPVDFAKGLCSIGS
ncbi:MAG: P-II family nitrogen regulator [Acetobacterium sp.]|uniref:P-II family nitrogen regulator n=1 Tax=Acetobacterium sp. TaxID=1872094 RepID=UPI003241D594